MSRIENVNKKSKKKLKKLKDFVKPKRRKKDVNLSSRRKLKLKRQLRPLQLS